MLPLLSPDPWHSEVTTDLANKAVGDLRVPRHRLHRTGLGIAPQGMGTALTLEFALRANHKIMMIDATPAPKVGFISLFFTTACSVKHINAGAQVRLEAAARHEWRL
jgi:hypothetical protein